jgi:glycosyltransferase involved in cell wall biosynthesis
VARLLFVVNDAAFFVSHRLHLAIAARRAGYDVHVAVPRDDAATAIGEAGLALHDVPLTRAEISPFGELRSIVSLVRLYRRIRPDIVHHVTQKPVVYGSLAARMARVPAVVNALAGLGYVFMARGHAASAVRRLVRGLYRVVFRRDNVILIVQNADDRDLFIRLGIVPASRIALIRGSGVDVTTFVPAPAAGGTPIVLFAARMLRDKGVVEFVEAARIVKGRSYPARFVLVGGIDENPSAIRQEQLEDWQREGVVEWWGHRTDMPDVLTAAEIVCLPSYREGLPKVLLEAMACARPIVTTDVPGCREVVVPGETGLLVPVRDAAALARGIMTLLDDEALRRAFGRNARERAVAEFGTEMIATQTLQVYDRFTR